MNFSLHGERRDDVCEELLFSACQGYPIVFGAVSGRWRWQWRMLEKGFWDRVACAFSVETFSGVVLSSFARF